MTTATLSQSVSATPTRRVADLPLWLGWTLAVVVAVCLSLLAKGGRPFAFVDSDDALRLIQVRELIAGASWFEVNIDALGGRTVLHSHWSRLVDAPIALLLLMFKLVMSDRAAEGAVALVWPSLLLASMFWIIARTTDERGGRTAAFLALAYASLALIGYYQFVAGRLDHHNVMIAATVSSVLLVWGFQDTVRAWGMSGALAGLAIVVGYEALAPAAVIALAVTAWGLFSADARVRSATFAEWLLASLALAFLATTAPSRWMTVYCDALSLNLLALAIIAGGTFSFVMRRGADWSLARQLGTLTFGGAVGLAVFGWLEPVCLAGPLAQAPKALWPLWIDHVEEARSVLADLFRGKATAIGPVAIYACGLLMIGVGLARSRAAADRFLAGTAVAFVVLACWQMKYTAYAAFILAPAVAIAITRIGPVGSLSPTAVRALAILLLNPFVLYMIAMSLRGSSAAPAKTDEASAMARGYAAAAACRAPSEIAKLSTLPSGSLITTHNDLGTFIATETRLRALSGPYHRIPEAIVANNAILGGRELAKVGAMLADQKIDFVVSCMKLDAALAETDRWRSTLVADLVTGRAPKFLVPLQLPQTSLYKVWRVDRAALR